MDSICHAASLYRVQQRQDPRRLSTGSIASSCLVRLSTPISRLASKRTTSTKRYRPASSGSPTNKNGSPGASAPSRSHCPPSIRRRSNASATILLAFYRALNNLYNRSARGTAPAFIAEYLDRGKPERIVKLARQNRFKQEIPASFVRTSCSPSDGFAATELDSVPGGMGFVGAMTEAYCQLGIESVGGRRRHSEGFAAMLRHAPRVEHPTVAIVVSDESADYRSEMGWLADALRRLELADAWLRAPQEIIFTEDGLFIRHEDGREERLDAIYRNFELFDLLQRAQTRTHALRRAAQPREDDAAAESQSRRETLVRALPSPRARVAVERRTRQETLRAPPRRSFRRPG